ncbi:MAG: MFS transporter [Candidatus Galacturonibacter soehngenii]|nr:MFS transporter [Candidatus Galacturonibacter soehngenii]
MENYSNVKKNLKIVLFLGSFAFGFLSFILPIYSKNIGGSGVSIGGLFSVFSIISLLLRPIIGRAIDKYGRKCFFVSSFIFYAISMILFSYSTNILLLYLSRLIQAIGASMMWITSYSIAADIADNENKGKTIGQVDGASSKGALCGAIIGFIILSNFSILEGWSILFKGYAILALLAAYIAYKKIPETSVKQNERTIIQNKNNYNIYFYKLLSIVFITSLSTSMLSPVLMIYLQDRFTSNIFVLGLAFTPAAYVYAFLPSKLGGISDKVGRVIPMVVGLLCAGIISLGFSRCNDIRLLVILWVLESIGLVLASPAEEALVADIVDEKTRGSAYGTYFFVSSLGAIIGPLLGGWLYDGYGHHIPFYVNAILLFLNSVMTIVLLGKKYKL